MDAKYSVGDVVHFFDDPEPGVVEVVLSEWSELEITEPHYLVKFAGTLDQEWPGFVYPERFLKPPASTS